jgi:hypothetical protein
MRTCATDVLSIFASFLLAWFPAQAKRSTAADSGQSLTVVGGCTQQHAFQLDLQPDTGGGPHFVVTNLCAEPLTAFYLETSSSAGGRPTGGQLWDALSPHRSPLAKDGTISQSLAHVVGQPFSDKIETTAAVWADGGTFGDPEKLKRIFLNRITDLQSYERAISLVQKGLQENWTRDQYVAAWDQENKKAPLTGAAAGMMEVNLWRNSGLDSPSNLRRIMQHFREMFIPYRDVLRQSKPDLNAVGNSNGRTTP